MLRILLILLILSLGSFSFGADVPALVSAPPPAAEPRNCVNEGGSCDGSVPCCQESYCVRNRCQRVPEGDSPVRIIAPADISKLCAL